MSEVREAIERIKSHIGPRERAAFPEAFDAIYAGAADDIKLLLRAAGLQNQYATTVAYYNAISISSMPPSLERSERWERNKERFGDIFNKDLGWLWSAVIEASQYYEQRRDKDWEEMTPQEQDMCETVSFLHNWVKLVGLQKWSSEAIAEQVRQATRAEARRELLAELLEELPAPASLVEPAWLEEKLAAEPLPEHPVGVPFSATVKKL